MLLYVFNQVLDAEGNRRDHLNKLDDEIVEETCFVPLSDAVADPGTVVIMRGHALIARFAMFRSYRLLQMADRAVFHLDKKHHIVILTANLVILLRRFFINRVHLDCLHGILGGRFRRNVFILLGNGNAAGLGLGRKLSVGVSADNAAGLLRSFANACLQIEALVIRNCCKGCLSRRSHCHRGGALTCRVLFRL